MASPDWQRILGVRFFDGAAFDAVDYITRVGGYTVVPAAPALVKIENDPTYRRALVEADLAIADSGFMVLLWRLLQRRTIARISGLKYLRILLAKPELHERGGIFLVLPHQSSLEKALAWLRHEGFEIASDDCYIAPMYQRSEVRDQKSAASPPAGAPPLPGGEGRVRGEQAPTPSAGVEDQKLVSMLESRKPKHIIIGIGGGMQDKLGSYLKHQLTDRPGIYCIGAAPGFVTGDQIVIPMWGDRFFVGWIFRIIGRPRDYLTRYWKARFLPLLIIKYGTRIPQLRTS